MKNTKIEWCDHTVNFWWGCTEVSEACKNCYARAIAKRFKVDCWGDKPRHLRIEKATEEVRKLNASAKRRGVVETVFVNSMSDFFDENIPMRYWLSCWELFAKCNNLLFMILTKRAWLMDRVVSAKSYIPKNVHFGITAENQARLDERMLALKRFDRKVFLSCEPLLSPIDITEYMGKIDWLIVGGENTSYDKAREFNSQWAYNLREQCRDFYIPFFFKRVGKKYNFSPFHDDILTTREFPEWQQQLLTF